MQHLVFSKYTVACTVGQHTFKMCCIKVLQDEILLCLKECCSYRGNAYRKNYVCIAHKKYSSVNDLSLQDVNFKI